MSAKRERGIEMVARIPSAKRSSDRSPPAADTPFRVLVLADFSGRGSRGVHGSLRDRRPRQVDRDNLDAVLAGFEPELDLPTRTAGEGHRLHPRSIEELHPDHLWEELDAFAALRSLRRRLSNPDTFAAAAEEIRGTDPAPDPSPAASPPPPSPVRDEEGSGFLEQSLRETESEGSGTTRAMSLVDAILRDLVIPRVPATPGQEELVTGVDDAAAEEMRALLGSPQLSRLEANWRGTELLVRRIETDARLQIWIVDVTAKELVEDVVGSEDPRATELWRALFEPDAADGAPRWAAWTTLDLFFGGTPAQAALLGRFARLAANAGAPLLAGVRPDVLGCSGPATLSEPDRWDPLAQDAAAAWAAVRGLPESSWVLATLPRMLLREPYGRRTNPCERFQFEELGVPPDHEDFLWGSGALAPALALAQEFSRSGWQFSPRGRWEIDRLPTPVVTDEDGETVVKPCGEVLLTERAHDACQAAGLTPLITVRDTDRIHVGPLTSLAGTPLAGRWSG